MPSGKINGFNLNGIFGTDSMDKWRAKNASHSCTPPATVAE
jgi:hypothetical protein